MATFLFAWNPKYWNWPELRAQRRVIAKQGHVDVQWASGATRVIEPGSRAFMVRLGVPPKGLIGAGVTMTEPVEGPHWRDDKKLKRATTRHLWIRWDSLFEEPVVTFDDLAVPPYSRFRWATRASGMRIPSNVADALEVLWEAKLADAASAAAKPARRRGSGARSSD
ncbi:MAG TPA: hypothetical protein VGR63_01595 [Casimicrobiaceae bacterium]|nr:hypothetical protein [Casimicrobiaceae bacterium]